MTSGRGVSGRRRPARRVTRGSAVSTPITRSVKVSEAPSYGTPLCYHDPYGKATLEYADVAKELTLRI